jgi:hypothetical protein
MNGWLQATGQSFITEIALLSSSWNLSSGRRHQDIFKLATRSRLPFPALFYYSLAWDRVQKPVMPGPGPRKQGTAPQLAHRLWTTAGHDPWIAGMLPGIIQDAD